MSFRCVCFPVFTIKEVSLEMEPYRRAINPVMREVSFSNEAMQLLEEQSSLLTT